MQLNGLPYEQRREIRIDWASTLKDPFSRNTTNKRDRRLAIYI